MFRSPRMRKTIDQMVWKHIVSKSKFHLQSFPKKSKYDPSEVRPFGIKVKTITLQFEKV